ncbi:phosphopantetheine-binding protein [uncultured Ruminococcus sp.]|uniref:phosphopantetheine-binding protein n=1 Tax=uncultured Ruminococcus sp. TaxID=165186 RepID=UPI0025D194FB|nr:phosphopantetheine-binding protein [uncultured Ruminococcus sp.]
MKEQLMGVLEEIRPDVDFENEKQLITDGVLDSFDIVSLVTALNDEFDIEIEVGNLVPDNFNSIEGMMALIEKLQDED